MIYFKRKNVNKSKWSLGVYQLLNEIEPKCRITYQLLYQRVEQIE